MQIFSCLINHEDLKMSPSFSDALKPSREVQSLLIDHQTDLGRNLTKILMEIAGCTVSTCEDFDQAKAFFDATASNTENTSELVVIDSPTIINHYKVLRAIRSAKPMPQIISLIPANRMEAIFDLFEAGSNMVVTYPFVPQKFMNAIHRCLSKPDRKKCERRIDDLAADCVALRPGGRQAVASSWF